MPSVDDHLTLRFRRNPASRVYAPSTSKTTPAKTINTVTYVADHNPTTAMQMIWTAIERNAEFCICHDIPVAPTPSVPRDGVFFQTQSGGTTGAPKRIRRSHSSWIHSFETNAAMFGIIPNDRYAILGRLGHSLALYAALEASHIGADIHFFDGLSPNTQMERMNDAQVTILYGTPSQLRRFRGSAVPSVRFIFCGGGTLDMATRDIIGQRFPNATFHEFYGASETSFITMTDANTPLGSVGRAYPNVVLDIRTPDHRGVGSVWVKSPYVFTDYADGAPRMTWVSAGEMGRVDDGYLTLLGRGDRMITIADQNVFPERIEGAITAHPDVRDAVVIPTPDPQRGHILRAYVVGKCINVGALKAELQAEFGPLIAPKSITSVDEIPTTPAGKHDLRAVQNWVLQHEE